MRRVATVAMLAGLGTALAGCASTATGASSTGGHASGAAASPVSVGIRNFTFTQQIVSVTAGTAVTWTNRDSSIHTVTANDHSYDSGHLAQGQSYRHTFRAPGRYGYHCDIHQYMTGTVIVTG
jgi:plastocyanin